MKKLLAILWLSASASALAVEVTDVRIKALDGFGGDTSAVAVRCQVKPGKVFDSAAVTRDVTSLKDSGEFEEINAEVKRLAEGIEVTYYVKRKMRFAAPLQIEGNEEFSESKIASESGLKDGYLYGEADFAAAAAKVREAYVRKHYNDAKVVYRTQLIGANDVTVTFVVSEGLYNKISSYDFEGAEHVVEMPFWAVPVPGYELAPSEINSSELREAINDYPWWNPLGWFSDSPITNDQLAQSCEKLAEVFRNHGYLDVKVTGPERVPDGPERVRAVYKVVEGPQYRIGTSRVTGVTRYPAESVANQSELPEAGVIAGMKTLNDAAHRVEVTVGSGDLGLADTRVAVKLMPAEEAGVVNIVYAVTEGVPVVINDVKVRGNDYTKDKVIRREIALGPGDRMLADRAERSKRRLENLDYFARVQYYLEDAGRGKDANGAEYRNLVYEVEEKNTGSFMIGVAASTVDSVYLTAEVNQNNFDLFAPTKLFRGAGQKGRISGGWGPRYQSAEVSVIEPYLFNRHLELEVEGHRRRNWRDEYYLIRSGASASLAYPVKFWPTWEPFGRFGAGIGADYIQFDDVDEGYFVRNNEIRQYFLDEANAHGDVWEPVINVFWSRDTRNNFRIPSRGYNARVFGAIAPGPDNKYWRIGAKYRHYFNVWKRFDHVFMVGASAETEDAFSGDIPIYDRLFLGGPHNIRGIRYRHVSPMIERVGGGSYSPWGGQTMFCMNFEYTIPIVKMLRFAIFSDLGSVGEDQFDLDFKDTFAWTGGIGARLDIPMFPIRLDFAMPFVKPDHAEKEVFSFTVGYEF